MVKILEIVLCSKFILALFSNETFAVLGGIANAASLNQQNFRINLSVTDVNLFVSTEKLSL
jgi:hypothetical protein